MEKKVESAWQFSETGRVVFVEGGGFTPYTIENFGARCHVMILDENGIEICSSENTHKARLSDDQLKRWCKNRSAFDNDLVGEVAIARAPKFTGINEKEWKADELKAPFDYSKEMKARVGQGTGTFVVSVSIPNDKLESLVIHLQNVLATVDFSNDFFTYKALVHTRIYILGEYNAAAGFSVIAAKYARNLLRMLNIIIADLEFYPIRLEKRGRDADGDVAELHKELNNSLCQLDNIMEL